MQEVDPSDTPEVDPSNVQRVDPGGVQEVSQGDDQKVDQDAGWRETPDIDLDHKREKNKEETVLLVDRSPRDLKNVTPYYHGLPLIYIHDVLKPINITEILRIANFHRINNYESFKKFIYCRIYQKLVKTVICVIYKY